MTNNPSCGVILRRLSKGGRGPRGSSKTREPLRERGVSSSSGKKRDERKPSFGDMGIIYSGERVEGVRMKEVMGSLFVVGSPRVCFSSSFLDLFFWWLGFGVLFYVSELFLGLLLVLVASFSLFSFLSYSHLQESQLMTRNHHKSLEKVKKVLSLDLCPVFFRTSSKILVGPFATFERTKEEIGRVKESYLSNKVLIFLRESKGRGKGTGNKPDKILDWR